MIGASGTGKGLYCKERLSARGVDLTLIWSPLEDTDCYAQLFKAYRVNASIPVLVDEISSRAHRFIVYLPPKVITREDDLVFARHFALFCRAAWECPGARVLVEELSRVTSPSWAPPAWRDLSTAGRHRGIELIGTSQFPAQIDKSFLGNCTEVRCFRLVLDAHAKAAAQVLQVPHAELLNLPDLHFIHRNLAERKNFSGVQALP